MGDVVSSWPDHNYMLTYTQFYLIEEKACLYFDQAPVFNAYISVISAYKN